MVGDFQNDGVEDVLVINEGWPDQLLTVHGSSDGSIGAQPLGSSGATVEWRPLNGRGRSFGGTPELSHHSDVGASDVATRSQIKVHRRLVCRCRSCAQSSAKFALAVLQPARNSRVISQMPKAPKACVGDCKLQHRIVERACIAHIERWLAETGNEDGKLDVVTTVWAGDDGISSSYHDGGARSFFPAPYTRLLLGAGDGTFAEEETPLLSESYRQAAAIVKLRVTSCVASDWDEDGHLDLVLSIDKDGGLDRHYGSQLLLGNGDGTFSVNQLIPPRHGKQLTTALVTADFDADGHADLVRARFLRHF